MATAAKSISAGPIGVAAGQIPLPGAAEMFAAMVAGASGGDTPGGGVTAEAAPEEIAENPEAAIDASVLLPMLNQQRAAAPAATLVKQSVDTPSPVKVKAASVAVAPVPVAETPVTTKPVESGPVGKVADGKAGAIAPAGRGGIRPTLIDGKGDATVAVAPAPIVPDPTPVTRSLGDGKAASAAATDPTPVMRPVENDKPAMAVVTAPAPVIRPVQDGKLASAAVTDKSVAMDPIAGSKPPASAVADSAPVMRPVQDGKPAPAAVTDKGPVMEAIAGSKPASSAVADSAPVIRPSQGAKSASITVSDKSPVVAAVGSKPAPIVAADPAPAMRPIDAAAPKGKAAQPAAQSGKGDGPVAIDAAPALQVKIAQSAPAPAQAQTGLAPKATPTLPAAAQPEAKAAAIKTASPEVQIAAADAHAAPVAAKARAIRASAAPVSIETPQDAAGATSIAATATATETRAAVQPLHAAPALVQPLAAPVGAPVQNVAAALSQQVLDMSGGDAWIDQIARDISQAAGKDGTMRFRLAPETLGELKVEITHSERGAHVRLNVSSEAAQHALAAAEHKLAAEARAQGVRIAETEITFTGGQSQSRDASAFAREQGQQQAQASHQPRTPRGTSANDFTSPAAAPQGRGRTDRYA